MASYSSSISIEELDQNLAAIRTLELRGPGLPRQGANWGGENVVPTTWYAGNPDDATQQMLVAKELPSKWEGMWHLTMLNRIPCRLTAAPGAVPAFVTSPGLLVDVLDDMRMKGRLLRVTWSVQSDDPGAARTITRLGRPSRMDFKYKRSVDVDWEIEWSWKSRGGVQSRVVSTRDDNVKSATTALQVAAQAAIVAANSAIQSVDSAIRKSASQFTLSQLSQLADAPLELVRNVTSSLARIVSQFNQVAGIVEQVRVLPFEMANSAVDLARNTVDLGNQFVDSLNATPCEQTTLSNNVSDLTRSFRYFGDVSDKVEATNQSATEFQGQIRQGLSSNAGGGAASARATSGAQVRDVLAVRITRAGDTPASLSMTYYGTPDRDVDILRFNRLPWHQASFERGSLIVIPVLSTSRGV